MSSSELQANFEALSDADILARAEQESARAFAAKSNVMTWLSQQPDGFALRRINRRADDVLPHRVSCGVTNIVAEQAASYKDALAVYVCRPAQGTWLEFAAHPSFADLGFTRDDVLRLEIDLFLTRYREMAQAARRYPSRTMARAAFTTPVPRRAFSDFEQYDGLQLSERAMLQALVNIEIRLAELATPAVQREQAVPAGYKMPPLSVAA